MSTSVMYNNNSKLNMDTVRSKMSLESIAGKKMVALEATNCSIMGWEDIAIIIKDNNHVEFDEEMKDQIESSLKHQQICSSNIVSTSMTGDSNNHERKDRKHELHEQEVPIPLPVGSGWDDSSCSSDSTESSGNKIYGNTVIDLTHSITLPKHQQQQILSTVIVSLPQDDTSSTTDVSELVQTAKLSAVSSMEVTSKVQFSTVQVREYDIVLGDHPFCDMYPLSLGWNYVTTVITTTDDYEMNHRRHLPNDLKIASSPVVGRKTVRMGNNKYSNNQKNNAAMMHIRARKLSVMERMSLLIEFTGLTSQQLFQLERKRQLLVQDEKFLYSINNNNNNASLSFL